MTGPVHLQVSGGEQRVRSRGRKRAYVHMAFGKTACGRTLANAGRNTTSRTVFRSHKDACPKCRAAIDSEARP